MKVSELLKKKKTLSFEFFPPKTPESEVSLFQTIGELKSLNPDFVSVTYGAMGTTRDKTFDWVAKIKRDFGIEPVSHLTCISATKDSIIHQIETLKTIGISNILGLRGDIPAGVDPKEILSHFEYAKDLISFIKSKDPSFCLGAAAYPEGHISNNHPLLEAKYLKIKEESGAEYAVTQLFFQNENFFKFLSLSKNEGVTIPIVPGIMIITSFGQIKRISETCGSNIPIKLLAKLEEHKTDNKAVYEIGVEFAIEQVQGLLDQGVDGLHFFVMNRANAVKDVLAESTINF